MSSAKIGAVTFDSLNVGAAAFDALDVGSVTFDYLRIGTCVLAQPTYQEEVTGVLDGNEFDEAVFDG